jgi:cell division septation protein DedD
MAKDYAKAMFKTGRMRKQQSSRRILLWIFAIFLILASFVGYLYEAHWLNKGNMQTLLANIKTAFHHPKPPVNEIKSESLVSQDAPIHFDFYTELPSMQVTLPVTQNEVNKAAPPPIPAAVVSTPASPPSPKREKSDNTPPAAEHYIVQVGAYKNDSTASEVRISILLAGFDAKVVKTIKNNQMIYRIQQGPYSNLAEAKNAQKNLQAKGFDGIIQIIH